MQITGDAKTIAQAYIKARSEMGATVTKDAKGNYSKYATLAAIVEATTTAFINNGMAVIQEVGTNEQGVTIDTYLIHESGATMQLGSLTMPIGDRKPQSVGSGITYGRRYALAAACGLAPDEDDDGEAAQASTRQPARRPATPRRVDSDTGEIVGPSQDVEFQNARERQEVEQDAPEQPNHPVASQSQLNKMHALGNEWYRTKENWDRKRPEWTREASGGTVESSTKLSPEQVEWIITCLESRIAKRAQKEAQQAQQEAGIITA